MDLLRTLAEKVDPAHAALVTVDVQNDFCHDAGFLGKLGAPMGLIQAMAPKLVRLLAAARRRGVPVIHVISHHDECYASPVVTEQKLRHGLPLEVDGRPLRDAPYCLKGTWGAELYAIDARPGEEIVVIRSAEDVVSALEHYDVEARRRLGQALHRRALRDHTYAQRARQAEAAFINCLSGRESSGSVPEPQASLLQEQA